MDGCGSKAPYSSIHAPIEATLAPSSSDRSPKPAGPACRTPSCPLTTSSLSRWLALGGLDERAQRLGHRVELARVEVADDPRLGLVELGVDLLHQLHALRAELEVDQATVRRARDPLDEVARSQRLRDAGERALAD